MRLIKEVNTEMAMEKGRVRMRPADEGFRRAVCPFCGEILMESIPGAAPTTNRMKCAGCHLMMLVVIGDDGTSVQRYRQAATA